ncbi:cullin-2 [Planococcus citri]|uniref:cullin-2 n=1 Tax=Planococcus citri TaxID=170843 RepID=UPI0031F739E2
MSLKPKEINFNETWNDLQKTVYGVITLSNVPRPVWNDRFLDVYRLCVAYPESLADKLYVETKNFLDDHVKQLLEQLSGLGHDNILHNYYEGWSRYSEGIIYLHKLYLYLNQQHIKTNQLSEAELIYGNHQDNDMEQMEIGELGLEIWKKNMIEPLQASLVSAVLECINQDRIGNGHLVNAEIVRGVIESFVTVNKFKKRDNIELYKSLLEKPLVAASGEYFRIQANNWFQNYTITQYMERVIRLFEEESIRCQRFLHSSSHSIMKTCCEKYMVEDYLSALYSEAKSIISQERQQDMANMYILLRSVSKNLIPYMAEFKDHIVDEGLHRLDEIKGDNMCMSFVEIIMSIYKKYKQIIEKIFQSDKSFTGALDKACIHIVNYSPESKSYKSSELLAKYCDQLLKKSSKGLSEMEVDEKLSDAIIIFKYLDDKDMFQKFYSRMLAKRLIHQNSQSMDAEESMIDKLKTACGYEFTNKLHRMFTDMKISEDLIEKFNASYLPENHITLSLNFHVHVLQAGSWPLGQAAVTSFTIPQEFTQSMQAFEKFYNCHYNGRRLTWMYHLSQGELKLCYLSKVYFITMQTFQMAILLLFESSTSLQCSEIQSTLQLNWEQFLKNCVTLVECKILTSNTKELKPDTVLSLNEKYSNKRTRLRITASLQKETPMETTQTIASVEEDRKLFIQATIVRVMKSRKLLKHNALIQEILSQCSSFNPSINMIKKCIETLIEKQYMERDRNSRDEYSYIA